MDKSIKYDAWVDREERFRVPSASERALGLWVDRVGRMTSRERPERLRILGQYAHVHVLSGRGVYLSDASGCLEVGPGDCLLVFPDVPCVYYPAGSWTTCWVTWNGVEGVALEASGLLSRDAPVVPDSSAAVVRAHSRLIDVMHDESAAAALRRKTVVLEMVSAVHASWRSSIQSPLENPVMRRVTAWLHDRFASPLTVSGIACEFGMSVSHFRKVFKAYVGRSPSVYIRDLRMVEAKRLLREGMPIKRVACAVGYPDVFHFMRVFKSATGLSAGRYRDLKVCSSCCKGRGLDL